MAGLESESLNRADGTRKWHSKASASLGENGLYLWLGDGGLKAKVKGVSYKDASSAENGFYNPTQYSTFYTAGNADAGYRYYVQDPDSQRLTHHQGYCGSQWIGIARIAAEPGSDKWKDWTHVMHWNPSSWIAPKVPRPEEVFEAIRAMTKDYPNNVRGLTNRLVNHFGLRKIDQEFLAEVFPWLDRRLGTKPEGE